MKNILLSVLVLLIISLGCIVSFKCYNANIAASKAEFNHYEDQYKKYTDSIATLSKQKIDTTEKERYFIVYFCFIDKETGRTLNGMRWFCRNTYPSVKSLLENIPKEIKRVSCAKHSVAITNIQELSQKDFNDFDKEFDNK